MAGKFSIQDQVGALNRHDPDGFAGFYTADAVIEDPQYPEPLKGRAAIRKDIAAFVAAFPDLEFTVKSVLQDGNSVAFDGVGKGTHKGPMVGPEGEIPATNRPMQVRFAALLRVNDEGLITEERRYFDLAGLMQQLGVMG
jgi:steroid delta-isomerase-like uncharacterized protein